MIVHMKSANRVDIPIDFVILQLGFHVTQHQFWLSICSNYTLQYNISIAAKCALWLNEGKKKEFVAEPIGATQQQQQQQDSKFFRLFIANISKKLVEFLHWPFHALYSWFDFGNSLIYLHFGSGSEAVFKQHRKEEDLFVQQRKRKWWNWFRQRMRTA